MKLNRQGFTVAVRKNGFTMVLLIVVLGLGLPCSVRAALWFGGVELCSVATIKVLLKVLGKTFMLVLLCHSSDRVWF